MILMRANSIVDAFAARTNLMVEEAPAPITPAAVWYPESRNALKVMSAVASEIGLLLNLYLFAAACALVTAALIPASVPSSFQAPATAAASVAFCRSVLTLYSIPKSIDKPARPMKTTMPAATRKRIAPFSDRDRDFQVDIMISRSAPRIFGQ